MNNQHRICLLFAPFMLFAMVPAATQEPVPESPGTDIGYPTREAALEALRQKPGVAIREQNDWVVVTDRAENTLWSITSPSNSAHPTVVKRTAVERGGSVVMEMKVKCGASKEVCDDVVRQFEKLNESIGRALRK
jgi:hypothetical protein